MRETSALVTLSRFFVLEVLQTNMSWGLQPGRTWANLRSPNEEEWIFHLCHPWCEMKLLFYDYWVSIGGADYVVLEFKS